MQTFPPGSVRGVARRVRCHAVARARRLRPARDREQALPVLRRAIQLGVNHIDTVQFYGPTVANELIRAALAFDPNSPVLGNDTVRQAAAAVGHTPAQIVLAWTLSVAPNALLIPGTSSPAHLEENLAVTGISLPDDIKGRLGGLGG